MPETVSRTGEEHKQSPGKDYCRGQRYACCGGIRDLLDLYCLAQIFEVKDLMWRCEEEIVLKVNPDNVVCILVNYFKRLSEHKCALEPEPPVLLGASPLHSPSSYEEHKSSSQQQHLIIENLEETSNQ